MGSPGRRRRAVCCPRIPSNLADYRHKPRLSFENANCGPGSQNIEEFPGSGKICGRQDAWDLPLIPRNTRCVGLFENPVKYTG
eukprot:5431817-Pyramimonas_sp.AAC.1